MEKVLKGLPNIKLLGQMVEYLSHTLETRQFKSDPPEVFGVIGSARYLGADIDKIIALWYNLHIILYYEYDFKNTSF